MKKFNKEITIKNYKSFVNIMNSIDMDLLSYFEQKYFKIFEWDNETLKEKKEYIKESLIYDIMGVPCKDFTHKSCKDCNDESKENTQRYLDLLDEISWYKDRDYKGLERFLENRKKWY
ncbi:MAG: hypothetical protein ACK5HR_05245 [Mycoplasmatales bacterium]